MKFLIAGLGNMDSDYFGTRHNVGFEVLDYIASKLGATFKVSSLAHVAEASYKGKKLILIKPSTYMNLSGKALKFWMEKEKIELQNCFVILDDLNLDFGSIRIRPEGTDGGHNGLKDIQEKLATNKYPRLRIGIGNQFSKGKQVDYVLGKWNEKELNFLPEIIKLSGDAALSFCFAGLSNTMNLFNSKKIVTESI
ncbi:MAG: aminoacyl-tRNA hydrolase [Saprospiraceae bacterium]|jgi:PTH1 family peptidyl-tRNA hydrolase|nr:aminoacyl-tRNA hydrolase [Saprospiraceae bacterium]